MVLAVNYGTILELAQGSIDSRTMEAIDFVANTVGTLLMGGGWWRLDTRVRFVTR